MSKESIKNKIGSYSQNAATSHLQERLPEILHDIVDESADEADVEKELEKKQEKLVSGANIKTINGQSLLASGNIEISGGKPYVTINYMSDEYCCFFNGSVSDLSDIDPTVSEVVAHFSDFSAGNYAGLVIEQPYGEGSSSIARKIVLQFAGYYYNDDSPVNTVQFIGISEYGVVTLSIHVAGDVPSGEFRVVVTF